jgi:hypothetical protein
MRENKGLGGRIADVAHDAKEASRAIPARRDGLSNVKNVEQTERWGVPWL